MEQAVIYTPQKNTKRIKIYIPYKLHVIRMFILVQQGVNLRKIQMMLGHESPKTTEIYTKAIETNNKNIESPLDYLMKNSNLQT